MLHYGCLLKTQDLQFEGFIREGASGAAEAQRIFPKSVDDVEESEERMLVDHAGARKPHNALDSVPHVRVVTVNPAVGTGRLALLEWTSIEALLRIHCKSLTPGAQSLFCFAVMPAAIDSDHGFHGLMFPAHSTRFSFVHADHFPALLLLYCLRQHNGMICIIRGQSRT